MKPTRWWHSSVRTVSPVLVELDARAGGLPAPEDRAIPDVPLDKLVSSSRSGCISMLWSGIACCGRCDLGLLLQLFFVPGDVR